MSTTGFLEDLTPEQLGMPRKFQQIRDIQRQAAAYTLFGPGMDETERNDRRFIGLSLPPGSGKSMYAQMTAEIAGRYWHRDLGWDEGGGRITDVKSITLTANRALEDQYVNDQFSLVNVRGKANYTCIDDEAKDDWTCEHGDVNHCDYHGTPGCTYGSMVAWAKSENRILTNYQYWMNARQTNGAALEEEGNPIRLMFADEAHSIPDALSQFLSVVVSIRDLRQFGKDEFADALSLTGGEEWGRVGEIWLSALRAVQERVAAAIEQIVLHYVAKYVPMSPPAEREEVRKGRRAAALHTKRDRMFVFLTKLGGNIDRIVSHGGDGNWIWRHDRQRGQAAISFECIWPARYAERYLWSGVERIVLMSATLRPYTLNLAGIKKEERWYKEWPRVFPAHLSPVYYVPTGKMGRDEPESVKLLSVGRLDEMARLWEGRRGIVHTPSYDLARWIRDKARCGKRMVLNEQGGGHMGTMEAARKYRATPGAILVSPSYHTGHDFPDEACEWQFIPKLPWPSKGDPIVIARCETDDQYYNAHTMQKFVQSCYRGTRHEADRCTTVTTDDAVDKFRYYASDYAPSYFRVITRKEVPGPGPGSMTGKIET